MASDAHRAGGVLTVDLAALQSNYKDLAKKAGTAACGAAIKGDAYGLGLAPVAKALWQVGCRDFFVARPQEGVELRQLLRRATIYVLDGLYHGQANTYLKHDLVPALVSGAEIKHWIAHGKGRPCALHVDTGINRAGVPFAEATALAPSIREKLNITLVMSHLACADAPAHKMNRQQLQRFKALLPHFPGVPASLANSSGMFLGRDYHFNLTRPGIALYGGNPCPATKNSVRSTVTLQARVLQVKAIAKGETVGYSATWTARKATRIAVLALGYRDGWPRKLSSGPKGGPSHVWLKGHRCPVIGRVSMDMTVVELPPSCRVKAGDFAEMLGPHIPVDQVAGWAGTISYEVLTHLGNRYTRNYV
jgi:alanine racemase